MSQNQESLFEEFPPVSREKWEQLIKKDLGGADYKKKLRWDTGEGVEVLPFYRRDDIDSYPPLLPEHRGRWTICAPVFDRSVEEANDSARRAIAGGADALQFKIRLRSTSGMLGGDLEGTSVQGQEDFNKLFENIDLENIAVAFDTGMASPLILAMARNHLDDLSPNSKPKLSFSYDPFTYIAEKGQLPKRRPLLENEIVDLAQNALDLPGLKTLCAGGRFWHNTGGLAIHELGLSLASASEYLALLTDRGMAVGDAAKTIHFRLAAGAKYFPEIAKFRAMRTLWKQLLESYGCQQEISAHIHAESSTWNKTLYDAHMNMLRTTTEAMAAAIGGADILTVKPFDRAFREPDPFSQRIAKNSQIIMQEESYFDKVADPAAGSYYIEKLTHEIAGEAWDYFREVEKEGGVMTSLENGSVQATIESVQQQRDYAIARRGRIFVGTNQYPNPDERMKDDIDSPFTAVSLEETDYEFDPDTGEEALITAIRSALAEGARLGDLVPNLYQEDWSKHEIRTVSAYRGARDFEELRLATEKHSDTPRVLTLPMGDKKMRKARSTFTSNFFGCAGYEIEDPIGFDSVEKAAEAVRETVPDIAVICSSDKEYEELVPALLDKIKGTDPKPLVVVAANPEKLPDLASDDRLEPFIFSGSNVLKTLQTFHQKLGITKEPS